MASSKRPLRLTFLSLALLLLPGCVISPRIPSWPEGTTGQLDLSLGEGLIVQATINGHPVRLRVETGYAGIILNPATAERIAIPRSMFRSEVTVGRVKVRGQTGVAPVVINGSGDERRITWFERDIAAGADGIINIADLPYELVTIRLGQDLPGQRDIALETAPEIFWNLTYRHPLGDRTLAVRFRLDLPHGLITAAGGALLADAHGGAWTGEAASAVVGLGVERPVRPMRFARPIDIGGLPVDRVLVRTSDFLGRHALPEDEAEATDPDEVVITGRGERSEGRLTAFVGLDHLSACSRLSYARATRILTLRCRS